MFNRVLILKLSAISPKKRRRVVERLAIVMDVPPSHLMEMDEIAFDDEAVAHEVLKRAGGVLGRPMRPECMTQGLRR
jgi:hypothetical protein